MYDMPTSEAIEKDKAKWGGVSPLEGKREALEDYLRRVESGEKSEKVAQDLIDEIPGLDTAVYEGEYSEEFVQGFAEGAEAIYREVLGKDPVSSGGGKS